MRRVDPGGQRDRELAAGADVHAEALFGDPAEHGARAERLGRVVDPRVQSPNASTYSRHRSRTSCLVGDEHRRAELAPPGRGRRRRRASARRRAARRRAARSPGAARSGRRAAPAGGRRAARPRDAARPGGRHGSSAVSLFSRLVTGRSRRARPRAAQVRRRGRSAPPWPGRVCHFPGLGAFPGGSAEAQRGDGDAGQFLQVPGELVGPATARGGGDPFREPGQRVEQRQLLRVGGQARRGRLRCGGWLPSAPRTRRGRARTSQHRRGCPAHAARLSPGRSRDRPSPAPPWPARTGPRPGPGDTATGRRRGSAAVGWLRELVRRTSGSRSRMRERDRSVMPAATVAPAAAASRAVSCAASACPCLFPAGRRPAGRRWAARGRSRRAARRWRRRRGRPRRCARRARRGPRG